MSIETRTSNRPTSSFHCQSTEIHVQSVTAWLLILWVQITEDSLKCAQFWRNLLSEKEINYCPTNPFRSRGSSVYSVWLCIGGPGDRGSILGSWKRFFLWPLCPDRLWGPPNLLTNGYEGSFPRGQSAAGAWRWSLTSNYCRGQEWVGVIPPLRPSASMACSRTTTLY
jgi:hypothetical protein